jgi:hypothetical protein
MRRNLSTAPERVNGLALALELVKR